MSRTQLSYRPHNIAIRLLSASNKQCACKYLEYIRTLPLRVSCWIGGNKLDLMQFQWNHNSSICANHNNVSCIKWIESHEPCLNFNPREFIFNVFVLGSSMIESGIFSLESNSWNHISLFKSFSPQNKFASQELISHLQKDWNKYAKSWKIMQHKGLNKLVAGALTTLLNFSLSNTRCLILISVAKHVSQHALNLCKTSRMMKRFDVKGSLHLLTMCMGIFRVVGVEVPSIKYLRAWLPRIIYFSCRLVKNVLKVT